MERDLGDVMQSKKVFQRCWIIVTIILLLGPVSCVFAADASIAVSGNETQTSNGWDAGTIKISFSDSAGRSYSETVTYGQYSTAASVASAFGAMFSRDYYPSGLLCAHAVGGVIYFHLKGTASFGAPSISNPSVSFTLTPSAAWPHLKIIDVVPNSASVGTPVTISGTLFGSTQASSKVLFNGVTANISSWSDTSIVAVVPSGATTGNVVVAEPPSTSEGVGFTVLATTPTVVNLNHSSGYVGLAVNISGSGFGVGEGQGAVTFNGTSAAVINWSELSITAIVPSNATSGPVVVTRADGQTSNNNVIFAVSTSSCNSQ